MNRIPLLASRLLSGALIALTMPGLAYAVDAKVFDTPDAAAAAMVAALEKGTNAAIVDLWAMLIVMSSSPTTRRPSARTASAPMMRRRNR